MCFYQLLEDTYVRASDKKNTSDQAGSVMFQGPLEDMPSSKGPNDGGW